MTKSYEEMTDEELRRISKWIEAHFKGSHMIWAIIIAVVLGLVMYIAQHHECCKVCGSWQNYRRAEPGQDINDVFIFGIIKEYTQCKKCGHTEHGYRSGRE